MGSHRAMLLGLAAGRRHRWPAGPPRSVPRRPDPGPNTGERRRKRGQGPRSSRRSLPPLPGPHRSFASGGQRPGRRLGGHAAADLHVLGPADAGRDRVLRHPRSSISSPRPRWTPAGSPRDQDVRRRDLDAYRHGRKRLARQVGRVCLAPGPEVVQHEAVHAYCHQTFGRIGPVWYSEGMAEMGHYWKEGDSAVHAEPREIEFLHDNPPKSLAETLSPAQVTGDSLAELRLALGAVPFPGPQPQLLAAVPGAGPGIPGGQGRQLRPDLRARRPEQLWFEYLFFLQHIGRGYRVDLCAWDWKKKFACLRPGRIRWPSRSAAGRGWQPTGLTVSPGTHVRIPRRGQLADRGEARGRRCQRRRPGSRPAGGRLDERLPARPRVRTRRPKVRSN